MPELYHHGIKGQKWGVRRYQNYDGTLTAAGRRRLERADMRYVRKNEKKAYKQAYNASKKELKEYDRSLRNNYKTKTTRGKVNANYAAAYNKKMAELMNKNVEDLQAPSGRVIRFVAKRGDIGVYTALADPGYNMSNIRNGVYGNGKIAYKSQAVGVAYDERRK